MENFRLGIVKKVNPVKVDREDSACGTNNLCLNIMKVMRS